MRIVCPSCETAYEAPESVVAAHRPMRCARCRSEWIPGAPPPLPAASDTFPGPAEETLPEPEPIGALPAEPPVEQAWERPMLREAPMAPIAPEPVILAPFPTLPPPERAKKTVMAGWAVSVLVLGCGIWLAIAFRGPVMRHWPASERAYRVMGLK